jgi:hypothetical protein
MGKTGRQTKIRATIVLEPEEYTYLRAFVIIDHGSMSSVVAALLRKRWEEESGDVDVTDDEAAALKKVIRVITRKWAGLPGKTKTKRKTTRKRRRSVLLDPIDREELMGRDSDEENG